ncbi:4Fe-4S dicluster domain-containing protein [Thiohalobacter sp. IOR34]|uniref:4Fe-4S dicluster domain-containing protein n=1 Tax=Thiohalobacter sp. IOR34 TaxID=3057176 RepID=UPI0025B20988|nr:4Fe-4S dicluster domain-containing protein [Thiohalobacter sp. IOR34]WJW74909.1 4Fe-4S dicluster domain-containing protein [Thiohalobacter sp. IOR34]
MAFTGRQLAMVINLDKCLGCHTCTVACKNLWTNKKGREYMYWNNVESKPGPGYPRNWEGMGGGFDANGNVQLGTLPTRDDYGRDPDYDYQSGLFEGGGIVDANPEPTWLSNWDEDVGEGTFPNNYYMYIPRLCNHCTDPACLAACPRNAIYKREEDGIVLVDQERCRGYRYCVRACPYKKVMYNAFTKQSEKCIFCYPRIEKGEVNACAKQCPGRIRQVGFLDDSSADVYKLVVQHQVAIPLHPEYGTGPNVYYIPPFSGSSQVDDQGRPLNVDRIPMDFLRSLFGPDVDGVIATLRAERDTVSSGGSSEILELLNSNNRYSL